MPKDNRTIQKKNDQEEKKEEEKCKKNEWSIWMIFWEEDGG